MPPRGSKLFPIGRERERTQRVARQGRIWTISKIPWRDSEKEDFRFWYELLTPEERVEAVADALESCL